MSDNWVDALYGKFILRDLFGKIGPGFILMGSIIFSIFPEFPIVKTIAKLPNVVWPIVFAFAWVIGFAIQSFGEIEIRSRRLIRYFPKGVTEADSMINRTKFRSRHDYSRHSSGFERLVVIKEACGNTYVSMILSLIFSITVLSITRINSLLDMEFDNKIKLIALLIFIILIIYLLHKMHFRHVQEQEDYLNKVINTIDHAEGPLESGGANKA